jgi:formiminotetrahydrofolate cyclodeaminase
LHIDIDPFDEFLTSLASQKPAPGGGTVGPVNSLMAIALMEKVIALTLGKKKYAANATKNSEMQKRLAEIKAAVRPLPELDANRFLALMAAFKTDEDVTDQLYFASAEPSFMLLGNIPELLRINITLLETGNANLHSDLHVAASQLYAAALSAKANIDVNIKAMQKGEDFEKHRKDLLLLFDEVEGLFDRYARRTKFNSLFG